MELGSGVITLNEACAVLRGGSARRYAAVRSGH